MTDLNTVPPPPPPPPIPPSALPPSDSPLNDERQMTFIIYILFLAGFVSGWVTTVVGVVLAYINRDTAPDWLKSHHEFLTRTFWISLIATAVSIPLMFVLIGFPLLLAVSVWFIVRCAVGLNWLLKKEPVPNPQTWMI